MNGISKQDETRINQRIEWHMEEVVAIIKETESKTREILVEVIVREIRNCLHFLNTAECYLADTKHGSVDQISKEKEKLIDLIEQFNKITS